MAKSSRVTHIRQRPVQSAASAVDTELWGSAVDAEVRSCAVSGVDAPVRPLTVSAVASEVRPRTAGAVNSEMRPRTVGAVDSEAPQRSVTSAALGAAVPTAVRGHIAYWRSDGFYVTYEHQTVAVRAESLVPWCSETLTDAISRGLPVLLVFEDGDLLRPIIAGMLHPPPAPASAAAAEAATAAEAAAAAEAAPPAQRSRKSSVQARVDGERVEFTARDEVVLRCGEASITLRRNGRIVIEGACVESRARGTHRIKGGHVLIN